MTDERRGEYDVRAHLKRLQDSCDKERTALAEERDRNAMMRKAVTDFGRKFRRGYWIAAVLIIAMFGAVYYFIERNKQAIEVSCLVVVKVVRDSGANADKLPMTPVGEAQARIQAAFYRTVLGIMTPADRAALLRDRAFVQSHGGAIPEPRCAQIAKDPGKVRREVLQEP